MAQSKLIKNSSVQINCVKNLNVESATTESQNCSVATMPNTQMSSHVKILLECDSNTYWLPKIVHRLSKS